MLRIGALGGSGVGQMRSGTMETPVPARAASGVMMDGTMFCPHGEKKGHQNKWQQKTESMEAKAPVPAMEAKTPATTETRPI